MAAERQFTPKPGFRFDPVPPREALAFIRAKGWRVGFDHRDVWRAEHASAFTIAKAMELDVLQAIRSELERALQEGRTLRDFQQDLTPTLKRLGWWGVKDATDPVTGERRPVQLGSPHRLRTIYATNLRTARAAGQWERIERNRRTHPYLLYQLGPSKEHREEHVRWHGLLLPADDPWWETHAPPNGWGCKCWTRAVSRAEAERLKRDGVPDSTAEPIRDEQGRLTGRREQRTVPVRTQAPPVRMRTWRNTRTGQTEQVPRGIDPGWDYNPGKARLRAFVPPEQDEPPPASFPPGTAPPAMPAPRRVSAQRLLPEGQSAEDYARAFLAEFGADLGRDAVHMDVVGQPLVVSEALFRSRTGHWKSAKRRRGELMGLLAETVKDPDEVWWMWERDKEGQWQLYRHYMARWDVGDERRPALAIFRWGRENWSGVTAFDPDRESYLMRRRGGILAYRREE
jgi:hypothetical protein